MGHELVSNGLKLAILSFPNDQTKLRPPAGDLGYIGGGRKSYATKL